MEFRKFVLLPENELNRHVPTKSHLSDFDKGMQKILHSHLSDSEKVKLYYDLLMKKTNLIEFNQPYLPIKNDEQEEIVEEEKSPQQNVLTPKLEIDDDSLILNSVASGIRKQTSQLLDYLRTSPELFKWNKRGEIIYKNNLIPNSNLSDLITLILTQRKSLNNVIGKRQFLNVLEDINVPKLFIKNKHLSVYKPNKPLIKKQKRLTPNIKWDPL